MTAMTNRNSSASASMKDLHISVKEMDSMIDTKEMKSVSQITKPRLGERRQNKSETRKGQLDQRDESEGDDSRNQYFTFSNITSSDSRDNNVTLSSKKTKKSSRDLLIQLGKEQAERPRIVRLDPEGDTAIFQHPTKSEDEASYVDDLLKSLFDEESNNDAIAGESKGGQKWEEVQEHLLNLFQTTESNEQDLRDIIMAISPKSQERQLVKSEFFVEQQSNQDGPLLKDVEPDSNNPMSRKNRMPLSPESKPGIPMRPKLNERNTEPVSESPVVTVAIKDDVSQKPLEIVKPKTDKALHKNTSIQPGDQVEIITRPDGKKVRKIKREVRKPTALQPGDKVEIITRPDGKKVRRIKRVKKPAKKAQKAQATKGQIEKSANQPKSLLDKGGEDQKKSIKTSDKLTPRELRIQRLRASENRYYNFVAVEASNNIRSHADGNTAFAIDTVQETKEIEQTTSDLTGSFSIAAESGTPNNPTAAQSPSNPLDFQVVVSTPKLRKSSRAFMTPDGENSIDLSVSFKDGNSFESKDITKTPPIMLWRMDPLESLSDFIIQIENEQSGAITTYHVHKHILAVGPRRSKYLDNLFHSKMETSAHFVFDENVAKCFPPLLDFIYSEYCDLQLTTENSILFRHLAKQFQIPSLMTKVTAFIEQDMQVSNMISYVTDISTYNDHPLRKLVQAKCATNIAQISEMDSLWIIMDPDLFYGTLSCPLIDREKTSPYLSILVKEFTSLHKHELDEDFFEKLTSPNILPIIDRQAALSLLEVCFSYGSPDVFVPLQERCANTMACYWKITTETDRQRLFALLRNFPSSFTVDFLQKVESGHMTTVVKSISSQKQGRKEEDSKLNFSLAGIYDTFGESIEDDVQSWRLEPSVSYSDWTIRVKHSNSNKIDTYHIHKHVLAVGPYRSVFFSDIFFSKDATKASKQTTTLELNCEAAAVVPEMLDFLYSCDHELEISTETCVALRFLARTFKIWMLNKEILDFIEDDMSIENLIRYVEDSDSFLDEVVTELAIHFCATNISTIDVDSQILESFNPGFFGRVVSSGHLDPSTKCHVSILTAKYFLLHDLDENLLEDILKESTMQISDWFSALKMLQIVSVLKTKESEFFVQLRSHCTDVLKENWSELRKTFRNELFTIFLTLDSVTVADLFSKVEQDYFETGFTPMPEKSQLFMDYKTQMDDRKNDQSAEVKKVKKEMQDKINKLAAKKTDLEKKLKVKDKADAELVQKNIPLIVGAVSSLSQDSNLKDVSRGRCALFCSPE